MPEGPEQRQSERVDYSVRVDFESDDMFYVGFSRNMSDGGLFIATDNPLPPGLPVVVRFSVPTLARPVTVLGEVRWTRDLSEATPELPAGMGVKFLDLQPEHAEALNRFIAQREAIFYEE